MRYELIESIYDRISSIVPFERKPATGSARCGGRAHPRHGRRHAAHRLPDQSVFVADEMNHEVRVFGVDGVHRFTFGRNGEGPGEFGRLYSVPWLGDRLASTWQTTFSPMLTVSRASAPNP